jgi:maltose alpha-D-glucosyltransferase/alpha-amylase
MQWSTDRNAGFSRADTARLYSPVIVDPVYGFQAINVEAQERDPSSLLNWTRRIIQLRRQYHTFGTGSLVLLETDNRSILALIRQSAEHTLLVVANLSCFVQPVSIELNAFAGRKLRELFGGREFPEIGEDSYFLTLGPHGFYWFELHS